ncbi:MAG: hypothetical protein ACLFN5_01505 [bacterium]
MSLMQMSTGDNQLSTDKSEFLEQMAKKYIWWRKTGKKTLNRKELLFR